jgi:urease accessory protein
MITCSSILGNIYEDQRLNEEFQTLSQNGLDEVVKISRFESRKTRMKKTTDQGTDVEIILKRGTALKNGDIVYLARDKIVVVELEPENVAILALKSDIMEHDLFEIAVRIGHKLGKMHRSLKVRGRKIFVPVKSKTEMKLLEKTLGPTHDFLEITMTRIVFDPEESAYEP